MALTSMPAIFSLQRNIYMASLSQVISKQLLIETIARLMVLILYNNVNTGVVRIEFY